MTMGRKLTIPYYRPTFVQKELSEVGDGKKWCMLATADQLAELFYRVRDSRFTQGGYSEYTPGDLDDSTIVVSFNTGNTPSSFAEGFYYEDTFPNTITSPGPDLTAFRERSFCAEGGNQNSIYFSESYDYTVGPYTYERSDILTDELGVWMDKDVNGDPLYYSADVHVCGFSWYMGTQGGFVFRDITVSGYDTLPSEVTSEEWFIRTEYQSPIVPPSPGAWFAFNFGVPQVVVEFTKEVAWVDTSGSGDPLDPANSIYVGVKAYFLQLMSWSDSTEFPEVSAFPSGAYASTGMRFRIKLSGDDNEVSCPLYYSPTYTDWESSYSSSLTEGDDFVLEATEWWPYNTEADGSGDPVWDTLTGAKL